MRTKIGVWQGRNALTLVETIVCLGIVLLLLALIVPAIQSVRQASIRLECMNQLKQIGLAVETCASSRGGRLPSINGHGNQYFNAGMLFELLPYVDHGSYFAEVQAGKRPVGADYEIKPFLCPADPTLPSVRWGLTSYAGNALVFRKEANITNVYKDGASNTIAIAEHYAVHQMPGNEKAVFNWGFESPAFKVPNSDSTLHRATFADAESGDVVPVPDGDSQMSRGSIPGLSFQVRPRIGESDPRIPQTAHYSGMNVLMGDGSVQNLRRGMDERVFWSLVTPSGGETASIE